MIDKILITGATGFLGTAITNEFNSKEVITLGRTTNCTIACDLAQQVPSLPMCNVVIHCAGKAHSVPKTKEEQQEFFDVNFQGTKNLLTALENLPIIPKFFVFISSVAVYGAEEGILIKEDHELLAKDPYGVSKIQAEQLISEWCKQHQVTCSILRLPLLVGPNPPGNLSTMIKGIKKGYYFNIAGGKAKKSMVLIDDVSKMIPIMMKVGGIFNLTDGYNPNFLELSNHIAKQLIKSSPLNMPFWVANLLAKAGDVLGDKFPLNSNKLKKITSELTFDDAKARKLLLWKPNEILQKFMLKE